MQTVTVDILNNKAVKLLQELENLKLIRMRREKLQLTTSDNSASKYKGAMKKQSLKEVNSQLKELRNEWE